MKYKVTYDIDSGHVTHMEQYTSETIVLEDGELFEKWANSSARLKVQDGALVEDTSEVNIEENVVPSAAVAEALGLDPNVGIAKEELETLAADAGVSLEPEAPVEDKPEEDAPEVK